MIIVIDGPSGSGKSSTARAVAKRLGIEYLDSGALYRAAAWIQLRNRVDLQELSRHLEGVNVQFYYRNGRFELTVEGEEITEAIRSPEVTNRVSFVAAEPAVRDWVNRLMRRTVRNGCYIADGRDLGSAVFTDADLKFYMVASLEVRAKRRHMELIESGSNLTYEEVINNIEERDRLDSGREADPLVQADDAILIDTTGLSFDEQVEKISTIALERVGVQIKQKQ
ncbi:MAG: (d)CMP kinase [Balneolaceae bacterium]